MKHPIISLIDGTEVIETTGDIDAFQYGGGVLYRAPSRDGIFWQFWEPRDIGEKNFTVFTAPVPDNVLEYFDPNISELCKYSEIDNKNIEQLSRSKNPSERLRVVMAIKDVFGASRVDPSHEPELLSPHNIASRWGDIFGIDHEKVSIIDLTDFIVRESKYGDYECGCCDGTYLGRHDKYKFALCAIADYMDRFAMHKSNVYHEHEPGDLELVNWDPNTFAGKIPKRRGKLAESPWRNAMRRYIAQATHNKRIDKQAKSQRGVLKRREKMAAITAREKRIEKARLMHQAESRRLMEGILSK